MSDLEKIKLIESNFNKEKQKKSEEGFLNSLKEVLTLWRENPTEENIIESIYSLTAKMMNYYFEEKFTGIIEKLDDEDLVELNKFFYKTYSRISEKKNVYDLKPGKLFGLHENTLKKGGVGMLHRSLFSTMRNKK